MRPHIMTSLDLGLALLGFVLLTVWRTPPLIVVLVSFFGVKEPGFFGI
jgi:hypothetical protein